MIERCKQHLRAAIQFVRFFLRFNGVVIVAKLPHSELEKTGYYHRILAIDTILADIPILYADWNPAVMQTGLTYAFAAPNKQPRYIRNATSAGQRLLILLFILRCRKIYFHHVASIFSIFKCSMRLPFITSFVDLHGAAPEEHEMAGFPDKVQLMESLERFTLYYSSYYISVTEAMRKHLEEKYGESSIRGKAILLPIIQSDIGNTPEQTHSSDKYTIIYAGNTQNWQQIPKMLDVITKTASMYQYKLCCTDPDAMNALLPENIRSSLHATAVPHRELLTMYPRCHFGFALREDNIVNRVACPTKLVEYLAYGIVPIIDSPRVGDFSELGMHSVTLEMLKSGTLPEENERIDIARKNRLVFEALLVRHHNGKQQLLAAITPAKRPPRTTAA